jgi:hypothetical protein
LFIPASAQALHIAPSGSVYTYYRAQIWVEATMTTGKAHSETVHREVGVDVDALLAAISEIAEHEVYFPDNVDNPDQVRVNGRTFGSWDALAEAFELDIHDFSVSEINR